MEDTAKEPVSTQQLLDLIFQDPKAKYHLDLFTRQKHSSNKPSAKSKP